MKEDYINDALVPDKEDDGYNDTPKGTEERISWWRRLWNWIKGLFG